MTSMGIRSEASNAQWCFIFCSNNIFAKVQNLITFLWGFNLICFQWNVTTLPFTENIWITQQVLQLSLVLFLKASTPVTKSFGQRARVYTSLNNSCLGPSFVKPNLCAISAPINHTLPSTFRSSPFLVPTGTWMNIFAVNVAGLTRYWKFLDFFVWNFPGCAKCLVKQSHKAIAATWHS